jgi:phosphoribosylglycinamide formyltransferase-1
MDNIEVKMNKKIRIAVLGSTRGTDMEGVISAIRKGELNAQIEIVVSDKKDAYILERAKKHGIPVLFINPKDFKRREDFDKKIIEKLDEDKVDLVLLLGYMRILSPYFIRRYKNRIMNIHPSLLPAFSGGMDLDVHKLVIKQGIKITGCTLHFVDEGTDTGPIILQQEVKVMKHDTPESLKKRVQKAEQEIIIEAVRLFQSRRLKTNGGKVEVLSS